MGNIRNLAILIALAGCTLPPAGPASLTTGPVPLNTTYEQSIAAAAVKQPDYARTLQPIDASRPTVTVVHVQPYPTIDTKRYTWVASPAALKALCHGRTDPLLAIQQALGLPPVNDPAVRVFSFDARPADMFRPCASGPDITTTQCSMDLPVQSSPALAGTEHFVLKQMMDSYRVGFKYPGYPFTGMGWSYDWDPASSTHQGVSEYVVKPGSVIANVTSVTPAAFCGP